MFSLGRGSERVEFRKIGEVRLARGDFVALKIRRRQPDFAYKSN